jgi:hypothetical protein
MLRLFLAVFEDVFAYLERVIEEKPPAGLIKKLSLFHK